jgi:GT2 family glycosyltransferase/glycosyltransferase involved in cell wall biosynthesis
LLNRLYACACAPQSSVRPHCMSIVRNGFGTAVLNSVYRHWRAARRAIEESVLRRPVSFEFRRYLTENYGTTTVENIRNALTITSQFGGETITAKQLRSILLLKDAVEKLAKVAHRAGSPSRVDVSIIVPAFNHVAYTLTCLLSVLRQKTRYSFEVIVGDDASSDATQALIESLAAPVVHVRHPENLGFLRNCNACAEHAHGRYLALLNNDTIVLPGWLDELIDLFEADPSIGLVGSKLLFENGRLQEAGGIVWKDGSAWNYGRNSDPQLPMFNYVKDVDYCSGTSIATRTNLWRQLDGFDERFAPAYYEDTDLAFRIRQTGFRTVYQPASVVIHHEGMTHGTDEKRGTKHYQVENKNTFFPPWRDVLSREHFDAGQQVFLARDRSHGRPHMLVVDHYIPTPDRDAGSRSMSDIMRLFAQNGFQLSFWPENLRYDRHYIRDLQQLGIEVIYGSTFVGNFRKWISENGRYFDYAFLSRPHVSKDFIYHIRARTRAKILYYGHDIHYLRLAEQYKLTKDPRIRAEWKKYERLEPSIWNACDKIYYPSDDEVRIVNKTLGRSRASQIPLLIVPSDKIDESTRHLDQGGFASRHGLIFVGGFAHTPNTDGIKWFVKEIWPRVVDRLPDATLSIVGSHAPDDVFALASDHVRVTGYVDSAALARLYREARLAIVPLRYGAGVKGKLIEALSMGTPVVSTSVGMQGLSMARAFVSVADGAGAFADAIVGIYDEPAEMERMAREGLRFIEANFSKDAAIACFAEDIPELGRRSRAQHP